MTKFFLKKIVLLITLKIGFTFLYIKSVSSNFNYEGYELIINNNKIIASWLLFLFVIIVNSSKDILSKVYDVFIILYIIPILIIYQFNNFSFLNTIILCSPVLIFIIIPSITIKNNLYKKLVISNKTSLILMLVFILIILLRLIIVSNGNINSNFLEVYVFRQEFSDTQNSGIYGYFNGWISKIFIPYLLIRGFYNSSVKLIFIAVLFSILFFLFTGHKFIIFYLAATILLYYYFNNKINLALISNVGIWLIVLIKNSFLGLGIVSFFIRRAFFLPALINFNYLDFFSHNEKLTYSHAFLKEFLINPYGEKPQLVIGDYMNLGGSWVNSGFIGTGFMNLGILGVLFYIILLFLIVFIIFNNYKKSNNLTIFIIFTLSLITIFTSADLMTSMLTNGVLLILLSTLINEKKYSSSNNETR